MIFRKKKIPKFQVPRNQPGGQGVHNGNEELRGVLAATARSDRGEGQGAREGAAMVDGGQTEGNQGRSAAAFGTTLASPQSSIGHGRCYAG